MIMYNLNLIMNKGQRKTKKEGPPHNIIYQYSSKISKAKKSEESFWAKED